MFRPLVPLAALAVALLTTTLVSAHGRHRPPIRRSLVSMHLEDESGRQLRTFGHRGQTFVLGQHGQRYNIRIRNNGPQRVEVVLAVDGRDAVSGQTTDLVNHRGHVIAPHGSVRVQGFRQSMSSVASFRFTDPSNSYSGRMGTPHRVGAITLAAYPERTFLEDRPIAIPDRRWRGESGPPPPATKRPTHAHRGQPMPDDAAAPHAGESRSARDRIVAPWPRPRQNNLGTQYGESRTSRVMEVDFHRQNRTRAAQRITVRYDDAQGLRARGIEVFPQPRPRPLPRPVAVDPPSRFTPPPPPDRRWHLGVWVD
jgi:hypothetical protein